MGMMNRKQFAKHKIGERVKPLVITCDAHGVEGVCKCPVKQEFAQDGDINHIMKRYPGGVPLLPANQAVFADVSEIGDLADVMRRGDAAREAFMQLPAKLRAEFGNDPYAFLAFLADDRNYDEAVKLGLIEKKEPVATASAPAPAPQKEEPKATKGKAAEADE